jgi:tripartite-type tricarboxylate transporter receptor subunit TctC
MLAHLFSSLLGFAVLTLPTLLMAQSTSSSGFPMQPIKIVVGSEAGSAPDILARAVGQELSTLLGQPIVSITNRAQLERSEQAWWLGLRQMAIPC